VIVENQNVGRRARDGGHGAQVSIFEETGGAQSAVAHDRSLELFFDRYDVIARFVSLINDDPPARQVLYLYGLGGNGKSLLLRFLAARCCVRLTPC
jgi:hypothetical protein